MKFLLDTNVCVQYLRGKNQLVRARIQTHAPADLLVCSIVLAELWFGACRSIQPAIEIAKIGQFLVPYRSLPFDDDAAMTFGTIKSQLESTGIAINDFDAGIAAIALQHGLILVTHNTRDYQSVPGLVLEDWELP